MALRLACLAPSLGVRVKHKRLCVQSGNTSLSARRPRTWLLRLIQTHAMKCQARYDACSLGGLLSTTMWVVRTKIPHHGFRASLCLFSMASCWVHQYRNCSFKSETMAFPSLGIARALRGASPSSEQHAVSTMHYPPSLDRNRYNELSICKFFRTAKIRYKCHLHASSAQAART
jgi:hypothetical protein